MTDNEKKEIDRVEDVIKNKMKFPPKPNYLFIHEFYPSSGVDRMWQQDAQIRELATEIVKGGTNDKG